MNVKVFSVKSLLIASLLGACIVPQAFSEPSLVSAIDQLGEISGRVGDTVQLGKNLRLLRVSMETRSDGPFVSFRSGIYGRLFVNDEIDSSCAADLEADPISNRIVLTWVSNPATRVYCNSEGQSASFQCAEQINQCRGPGYISSDPKSEYSTEERLSLLPDGNIVWEDVYLHAPQKNKSRKYGRMSESYKKAYRFIQQYTSYDDAKSYESNCALARQSASAEANSLCQRQYDSCRTIKSAPVGGDNGTYICIVRVEVDGSDPK